MFSKLFGLVAVASLASSHELAFDNSSIFPIVNEIEGIKDKIETLI